VNGVKKGFKEMSDGELVDAVVAGQMKFFNIENEINDKFRAVEIRRAAVERMTGTKATQNLPFQNYDYDKIFGQCCENVIGYLPIPVGVAGPLRVDGVDYMVPMATTEGALVASTARGCRAMTLSGGVSSVINRDGMSRAPVLQCLNVKQVDEIIQFTTESFGDIEKVFNSTSRFARLQRIGCHPAGRKLFLRFTSVTGDAMGMNMVGKATEAALAVITARFPNVEVIALSGNVCTDKKASAMNWIEGRGKSVSVDCVIPGETVEKILKTTVAAVCNLNYAKNLVGSAVAGTIGGNNAHAANIVTACFLAMGQDPAQSVVSSNCMTLLEPTNNGKDLYCSVTMPSIEVGTVGGGTTLPAQAAMLELLGCRGVSTTDELNSSKLARIIASTVLAGEISLLSALSSGHLISSHLKLNRRPAAPAESSSL
jgi:hydroxymethylglutaryl-CoA reductase (NADPH)